MYETSDFRNGLKILIDGQPYVIVDFQHVKPGKGNQFTRSKMRNMITGANLERTFKSGEKFEEPDVSAREVSFLYKDDNGFNFMDQSTYDQFTLNEEEVGGAKNFIIENLKVSILFFNGKAIGVEVPNQVDLKVAQTDPGLKGNTVSGGSKPATLETGFIVHVPLHINEGDVLKVDTRTGEYLSRVNK
ncbi:MAG: elongation factor P [Bdellovibrionales bacterium]|nr:elongation factor P [Bdellovibrionales bacterium]